MLRARKLIDDRGQAFVAVALMLTVLMGFVGLVADAAWFELNMIRIQRAADAGALAGVVYLPTNVSGAVTAAKNESAKNGFPDGVNGVVVSASPDTVNDRILRVTVTAPVPTYFARLFGVNVFAGRRNARAEFILPVPMGSPQDYLGIYKLFQSSGNAVDVHAAPNAGSGVPLSSQGFWAAVITRGGQHSNGDAYSPAYDGGTNANTQYDPSGYSYSVELPSGTSNGEVWLFDPVFCAVGHSASGSYLGTGDHWIGNNIVGVTTQFRLWDTNGTPYTADDDTIVPGADVSFSDQNQVDRSAPYAGDRRYSDGGYDGTGAGTSNCSNDPYHNGWFRLATGLVAGIYRLQVTTSAPSNLGVSAENMFGIEVNANGPAGARVYGTTRMAVYDNLDNATSTFYLAQIPAVHAGKTLEIKLFDPGDVGGDATLRIKKPTPTGYVYQSFSFTASGGAGAQSGTNASSLVTAIAGASQYQNAWVTIQIALPANYGSGGLTPPGETEPGWWKIEYNISRAGNDTTTWEVNIRGNPVHLIVP